MTLFADCLNFLFEEYDRKGISYCILRNYQKLPESNVGSDIDLIIDRKFLVDNHQCILKMVSSLQLDYVAVIKRQYVIRYMIFKLLKDDIFSIMLDFHTDEEWKGAVYLSGDEILKYREKYKQFYIPSGVHEAVISWLAPLLSGGSIKERYASKVIGEVSSNEAEFRKVVSRIFNHAIADKAIERIKAGDLHETLRFRKRMQMLLYLNNLRNHPLAFIGRIFHFYSTELKIRMVPSIPFIALIGPDGTGKSTVAQALSVYFESLFKTKKGNIKIFHFRPGLFPNIRAFISLGCSRAEEQDFRRPHRARPSGFILSIFRLTYYFFDFIFGHWIKVKPLLAKNNLVIYDRYYYDLIVDPFRARINLPSFVTYLLLRFVPKPFLVVYLNNEKEVIFSRKQELPIEEIDRQLHEYRNLCEKMPNFISISSNLPPDRIAFKIAAEFIKKISVYDCRQGCSCQQMDQ